MRCAILVAAKGGRRSAAARAAVAALQARGLRVGGFLQRMEDAPGGGKRIELARLGGAGAIPLAGPAPAADPDSCSLTFFRAGFEGARRWVEEDAPRSDVLVLDGVGKLELSGEGHRQTLDRALASGALVVLPIRDDQLVYAMEGLGLEEPVASFSEEEGPAALDAFADAILAAARSRAG